MTALNAINDLDDDPILFTSSADYRIPVLKTIRNDGKRQQSFENSSEDELPEDPLQAVPSYSARTSAVLASLRDSSKVPTKRSTLIESKGNVQAAKMKVSHKTRDRSDSMSREAVSAPKRKSKPKDLGQENVHEEKTSLKEAKARERELARERKAQEKEEAKAQKRKDAEEKAKQKRVEAELAEVNRIKIKKEDAVKEMIVDLPASIAGDSFDVQAREFFKNLGVEVNTHDSAMPDVNIIKWRRKTNRRWDPVLERWQALPKPIIEDEKHILCLMCARELAHLATAPAHMGNLEMHVAQLRIAYPNSSPIYMIEGLADLLRKSKNAENRIFSSHVLNTAPAQPRKRKQTEDAIVDKNAIEDALLRLQVISGVYIHHTDKSFNSARWLVSFTSHIALIPHRFQAMNRDTTFCMESGQIKTGEDKADTFVKMLQEIFRVTPAIALGIASVYPSVTQLVNEGFEKRGQMCLEDIRKCANKNGAFTDGRVGPSISRRLYKVFMERDPESMDV